MSTLRISGGHVVRPDLTIDEADVLVDQSDGTILEVGDVSGGQTIVDAADSLVIPGLINAHTHVAMTLLRGHAGDKPLDAWLREDVWPVEAELEPADVRAGAALGIAEMIRSGVTAFSDMYFEVDETAAVVEQSGLRAALGHTAITVGKDDEAAHAAMQRSIDVAMSLDGAADGRIQMTVQPHSTTTVGTEYLETYIPKARAGGHPLHYHTNETAADVDRIVDEHGVRPIEYADSLDMLAPGDTLSHCVHVSDVEIDLLADRGVTALHCPAANMKIASGLAPVQRLLDRGVNVALATDGPASNNDLDMFDEMCDAAMIGKIAADDPTAIAAETAFEMATVNGARALGIDSGRIEPGANADLAVVDRSAPKFHPGHDPIDDLVYTANAGDVRHTICDGRLLMHERALLTLEERTITREATDRANALLERAGVR